MSPLLIIAWTLPLIMFRVYAHAVQQFQDLGVRKSLEEMTLQYEDEKNSMIAIFEKDNIQLYEDFYDEFDNQVILESSMNMIFFGPSNLFMRLDAETILHILTNTHKQYLPISRTLLTWDLITDGKKATYLQGREFMAFGSLLNVVPEEDLYYVNFGDPSVLNYFANYYVNLENRKFGILATAYRRYFGEMWYKNSSFINELGYLFCGFPSEDIKQITPKVFKDISVDILNKLDRCNVYQTTTLYNIATHPNAYGKPYRWTSYEVSKLGALFTHIKARDIDEIQLEAMAAIAPDVIKKMNKKKLEYFSKNQILRMNPKTRRIYILRVQLMNSLDMNELSKRNGIIIQPTVLLIFINIVTLAVY